MSLGKTLILLGLVLLVLGLMLSYGGKLPFLGRLPGDMRIERDNFTVYFPLGTSILISLVASLLLWLIKR